MGPGEQRVRKRTPSRVSARDFPTTVSSGSHPPLSGTWTASKTNRPRSHSVTSSTSGKGMVHLWQSHTQRTLEKVLQSRLVETFITIDVPSSPKQPAPSAKSSRQASHPSPRDRRPSPRASPSPKSKLHSPQHSPSRSTLSLREEQLTKRHSRSGTATSTDSLTPTPTSPNRRGVTTPTQSNGNASKSAPHAPQVKANPETRPVPNFISAIHKPSTNPCFALDIDDFSKWTDPSATNVTVQLWAKLRPDSPNVLAHDKGKERMTDDVDTCETQWRMAGKWDICLDNLVPDEVSFFQSRQDLFEERRTTGVCSTI